MGTNRSIITATTFIAALGMANALAAQTLTPSDPHHPSQGGTAQTTPPAAQSPGTGAPMPGAPGMAMPGSGNPMMGMMGQGGTGMGMSGMGMTDRVEGRIAFLRAEIKVTEAQTRVWNEFAQALRTNATKLRELQAPMMAMGAAAPSPTLVQSLEQQERHYAARLEGIRALQTALVPLYDALTADQKKTADELMGPHLGLSMGMAAGMGMMPMGGQTR
jgi:LTXXQ motif family protein